MTDLHWKKTVAKLKADIPAVFLALQDKETPPLARLFAGITVIYALSPIDLIPDFIPILGYLDDMLLLPLLVALTVKLIPKELLNRKREEVCWQGADGMSKRWYYGIFVVLVWALIAWIVLKGLLR